MRGVSALLSPVAIPKMVKVRQRFPSERIPEADIEDIVRRQLICSGIAADIRPGMRIAVACGSRGIHSYDIMVKAMIEQIRQLAAQPFIVAAMGSHGGATEAGQRQILTDYHITEAEIGCPVLCQMDTVVIGTSPAGQRPVYLDKNAAQADGILLLNRIKPHTSFTGRYESGLMKMMSIGLGKQRGAESIHGQNPAIMHELIEEYGRTILANCPVLGGIAVIENAYDHPWQITGVRAADIPETEPKLLQQAYQVAAKLLFAACDVLIVDRIGKNISGDGMDPNITGRFCTRHRSGGIRAEKVVVLDLTDETHGNAQGIGLADVTTRRLFEKMEMEMTYPTGVTNTFLHLMKIPMVMDTDREALQLALRSCPEAEDRENLKVIRIPDTAHIGEIEVSTGMLPLAAQQSQLEILSAPYDLAFDSAGNLF